MARFEEGLAALEGAEAAVAFASGMAATTAAVLAARTPERNHVVGVRPLSAPPTGSSRAGCSGSP